MELKQWKDKFAKAKTEKNYVLMDFLDRNFEMVGMP
jgi:hypothetical protein